MSLLSVFFSLLERRELSPSLHISSVLPCVHDSNTLLHMLHLSKHRFVVSFSAFLILTGSLAKRGALLKISNRFLGATLGLFNDRWFKYLWNFVFASCNRCVSLLKVHLQQRRQGLSDRNVIFHKTTKLIPAVPFTQNGEIIAFSLFQCGKCDVIGT